MEIEHIMLLSPPLPEPALYSLLKSLASEEQFIFLETTRISREDHRSYLFLRPRARLVCRATDDPMVFFARADEWLQRGYYLAGWLAYEFGYLLEPTLTSCIARTPQSAAAPVVAELFVFQEPHIFDHLDQAFSGAGPWPVAGEAGLPAGHEGYTLANLRLTMHKEAYLEAFARIKAYIAAGDTYQVNYTLKYRFDFSGSPIPFYLTLRRNQSVAFGAFLKSGPRLILSFSPELFFRRQGQTITVRPMKGTLQRGRTLREDEELIGLLKDDSKTRSENVMIVDLLRNDLGRLRPLKIPGGVTVQSLFDIETYETLHQMTSTINGNLPADSAERISVAELIKALFPCGSVTGAPKMRTMEIIRELEHEERGVYTGAIGFFAPTGEAVFSVPIRTVVLEGSQGEMGIGSGIVNDSDPEKEWAECQLKGNFLTRPAPVFQLLETMLWLPRQGYWLLDLHLERLKQSARYFIFSFNQQAVVARLQDAAAGFVSSGLPRRVRLTLGRDGAVDIIDQELPVTDLPASIIKPAAGRSHAATATARSLPRVVFSDKRTDSHDPYLFHKTTRRRLYDDERRQAVAAGFYEVLFCNEKGKVTEGSITNIFIRRGDFYLTPPVDCGLLNGVFRQYFMAANPLQVKEALLTRQDLVKADGLYVANSVRGLVEVELHR
jgi:para-aminobenzoate synthetase/4-amino-4-deoxychorismate lyase